KRSCLFLGNALLLSAVNLVMRGIAVSFNAYISRKTGAEAMGLFTLVMSIYGFAVTLALSCVNLASVRLTSERCAALEDAGADRASRRFAMRQVVRSVCLYSLLFGVSTGVLLYLTSDAAARYLLGDLRTLRSLRVLAVSLPALSLSSALSGYFTGLRKVSKNAVVAVTEQFIKIIVTSTALAMLQPENVEAACLAVVGGSALAEAWSLVLNLILYLTDTGYPAGRDGKKEDGTASVRLPSTLRDTAAISLPSAVGAYARQGLNTLEHLAIPVGLKKSGMSQQKSLAAYGLLQGIAFPLVMFPYAVIGSFTSLLIPEMAERKERGDRAGIAALTRQVYRYSALFSVGACGIFVNFAAELGTMVYDSGEAASYTFLLGLLVPFMYLDTAVDALLKGMGEQVYTMKVNVVDAVSGLVLVYFLTPRLGIYGYILTMWLCELGNLWASIARLGRVTGEGLSSAVRFYAAPVLLCVLLSAVRWMFMRCMPSFCALLIFSMFYILCAYILCTSRPAAKTV
ncbi:MAG: polysaccharide biosynthesis C-terminal domain-containing protein, partial [Eubacteriales bacterium]